MYAMINACNSTLEHLPNVGLTPNKANTVMAWAYWWKGYAYAQIGTLYYAGLITDTSNTVVSKYVDHTAWHQPFSDPTPMGKNRQYNARKKYFIKSSCPFCK